ncbi:MAG: hypothetical protein WA142_01250 [Rugosibacter sp.]
MRKSGAMAAWLGVAVNPLLNQQTTGGQVLAIHSPGSRIQVWVMPTNERLVVAREAARLI